MIKVNSLRFRAGCLLLILAALVTSSLPALGTTPVPAPAPAPAAQAPATATQVPGQDASPSPDSRQAEIERQKAELKSKIADADEQAKAIAQQIGISDARRAALQKENAQLKAQLSAQQQKLQQAESELGLAQSDLEIVKGNIAVLAERLEQMRRRLELRQRLAYKMGGLGGYLELLISAGDFRSFLTRIVFVRRAIHEDRSRFTAVQKLSRQFEDAKSEITKRTEAITAQKASIEAQRTSLASVQKTVSQNQQKVDQEISVRRDLLGHVEAEKAAYLKQVKELEAESRSIAALLKTRQKGQVFQAGGVKKLAWPTTGPVSSGFGYRTHPIFGDRRLHTGIDISAPAGQAVMAAEAGTVVWAGTKGGYGNTIILDHGNALATLYGHLSTISVSQGAKVSRGSRIGAVGCTGYCTGPHLHFETRVNGEPVNPMQFF